VALGAFIAGLVINESEYAHQALSDVTPLRDIFGMLFFVSVGMLLDPMVVWQHLGTLAIVVVAVVAGKAAILAGVVWAFGYRHVVPLAVGLTLFQVGEFAFVLAQAGNASGAIGSDLYALTLNTAVATMAVTPAVSSATPLIYERFVARRTREAVAPFNIPPTGLIDHVIVAGAGSVGNTVARALGTLGLRVVLIEVDDRRVQQARAAGRPVIYGDASHAVVLEAAGIRCAKAILVTVPTLSDVRSIVERVRGFRADLPIVASAEGPDTVRALYALGVEEVASPELEAAIEMMREALRHLNVPPDRILQLATAIRRDRYRGTGDDQSSDRGAEH
jgi:CPA2 family monovalent cation:H+ antiporter-2